MKVHILPSAMDDLAEGFSFYERQEENLGNYFLDSLFSDIDSLKFMAAFTGNFLDFTARFPNGFHSRFITNLIRRKFSSAPCSIVAAIQNGFGKN